MRDILHLDLNNFYASVECLVNPLIKDSPVVVSGDINDRKGAIIAKNYIAKNYGIEVGMTVYKAKEMCKNLVVCTINMELYNYYSYLVRKIYLDYTPLVEPYSIDECFMDITNSKIYGNAKEIADKIRERVKREIGLTISVGVSFNKTFAKIGSDLKKPDATTIITKENFKDIIWKLPIESMLGIGNKNKYKLNKLGIFKIGELANYNENILIKRFGKIGKDFYDYSNGNDKREVQNYYNDIRPKSVGNATTIYKDINDDKIIYSTLSVLVQSIYKRLINQKITGINFVSLYVKDKDFNSWSKRKKLERTTFDCKTITDFAFSIFKNYYNKYPVHSLGVIVSGLVYNYKQLSIFDNKNEIIDNISLKIREKYGYKSITKANNLLDNRIFESMDKAILDKKYDTKK
jgi:DNA polymerase IV